MSEKSKISFGFSKISKKPNVTASEPETIKKVDKIQYIDSLENNAFKVINETKEEKALLVIPMAVSNSLNERMLKVIQTRNLINANRNKKINEETLNQVSNFTGPLNDSDKTAETDRSSIPVIANDNSEITFCNASSEEFTVGSQKCDKEDEKGSLDLNVPGENKLTKTEESQFEKQTEETNSSEASNKTDIQAFEKDNSSKKETLEEMAAREILEEGLKFNEKRQKRIDAGLVIRAESSQQKDQESSLDDYASIPVADFGSAMLRGMGWDPNTGIGKDGKIFKMEAPTLRPKGMGLGADKLIIPQKAAAKDMNRDLVLKVSSKVRVTYGKFKNLYGTVIGFDDDSSRVTIKLSVGTDSVDLNQCFLQLVSTEEFNKYSKVLNINTYSRYKDNEGNPLKPADEWKEKDTTNFQEKKQYKQKNTTSCVNEESDVEVISSPHNSPLFISSESESDKSKQEDGKKLKKKKRVGSESSSANGKCRNKNLRRSRSYSWDRRRTKKRDSSSSYEGIETFGRYSRSQSRESSEQNKKRNYRKSSSDIEEGRHNQTKSLYSDRNLKRNKQISSTSDDEVSLNKFNKRRVENLSNRWKKKNRKDRSSSDERNKTTKRHSPKYSKESISHKNKDRRYSFKHSRHRKSSSCETAESRTMSSSSDGSDRVLSSQKCSRYSNDSSSENYRTEKKFKRKYSSQFSEKRNSKKSRRKHSRDRKKAR